MQAMNALMIKIKRYWFQFKYLMYIWSWSTKNVHPFLHKP